MIHHLHEALAQGTVSEDEAHGRIYAWVPGVVTDIDAKLYQIKARLGRIADNESTDWISQMGMGGMESLPEVGDIVGVSFADGDVHRGAYFCFPQSNSKNRPNQPIPLGTNLVGMFNFLVTQFNQLRGDFNNHTHATTVAQGPSTPAPITSTPPTSPTAALSANKGKASDGGDVAEKSSSEIVLSKRSRVR